MEDGGEVSVCFIIISFPWIPKEIDPLPDSLVIMPFSTGHRYALPMDREYPVGCRVTRIDPG